MPVRYVDKRGRPRLPPGEKKLDSMGFRPTPEIRRKLAAAAKANRRSRSREIEARLERSFAEEDAEHQAFGGKHVYALMRLLGSVVSLIEAGSGKTWRDDRATHRQVKVTIAKVLDALGPIASIDHDDKQLLDRAEAVGDVLAATIFQRDNVPMEHTALTAMRLVNVASELAVAMSSEEEWLKARSRLLSQVKMGADQGLSSPKAAEE